MSRITTFKDKIPKNSILARIFGLRQGYKDKSCPGQDFRETRTRWHPCTVPNLKGDPKYSERGPKGDLILSKKGT